MTPSVVRLQDVRPQPWRNGGGLTHEMLAWPDPVDWRVRLSVAQIDVEGDFSRFPGVARWIAVVQGAGVVLTVAAQEHMLACGDEPLAFDGAAQTRCRLVDGPTRDLNLMLSQADGKMIRAVSTPAGAAFATELTSAGVFVATASRLCWEDHAIDLPAWSLAWFDVAPARMVLTDVRPDEAMSAWWIEALVQEPRS